MKRLLRLLRLNLAGIYKFRSPLSSDGGLFLWAMIDKRERVFFKCLAFRGHFLALSISS